MGDSVSSEKNLDLKASLLTLAVLSGNEYAVDWVADFGRRSNTSSEVNGQHRPGTQTLLPLLNLSYTLSKYVLPKHG